MDDHDTLIVSHLRDPWKLILVDMDIALMCSMFGGLMLVSDVPILLVVGIPMAVGWKWQSLRRDLPKGFIAHLLYWFFPPRLLPLKAVPPSHCNQTVG